MIKINNMSVAFRVLLALICFLLPACNWLTRSVKDGINTTYKNLYVIDVNDKELYENARIAGSFNVQYDDLQEMAKKLDKTYDIVFYCSDYACTESDRAAKLMRTLGFEKVFVYSGGIHEWYLLSLKDSKNYILEGPADLQFLSKPIKRFEREETNAISSEALSSLLISRKAN